MLNYDNYSIEEKNMQSTFYLTGKTVDNPQDNRYNNRAEYLLV